MLWRKVDFGSYGQWVAVIILSISSFVTGTFLGWPAAAIPHFKDGSAGFTLTEDEQSWVVSIAFIGSVISPIPCGYILDKIGRRKTLLLFGGLMIISWTVLAFAQTAVPMYIARFLCGLWGGAEYTTVLIYVCEISDPSLRGTLGAVGELMLFGGVFFESALAHLSYRSMIVCSMIPVLFVFLGLIFVVPESPYYCLMKKDRKTATEIIKWLRGSCSEDVIDSLEDAIKMQLANTASFSGIFTSPVNLKAFFVIQCLKVVLGSCSIILLMSYSSVILPDAWVSAQNSFTVLCTVWVISGVFSATIMDKVNRRTFLYVSSVVTIIGVSCTSVWFYLRDCTTVDTDSTNWLPLVLLCIVAVFETGGIYIVPNVIKGEIFPINIKSKASALSCMTAYFMQGVTTYFFYSIVSSIGMYFNFVKIAITSALCIVIVKFALKETRGKSLEEIQKILRDDDNDDDDTSFSKIILTPIKTKY